MQVVRSARTVDPHFVRQMGEQVFFPVAPAKVADFRAVKTV